MNELGSLNSNFAHTVQCKRGEGWLRVVRNRTCRKDKGGGGRGQ